MASCQTGSSSLVAWSIPSKEESQDHSAVGGVVGGGDAGVDAKAGINTRGTSKGTGFNVGRSSRGRACSVSPSYIDRKSHQGLLALLSLSLNASAVITASLGPAPSELAGDQRTKVPGTSSDSSILVAPPLPQPRRTSEIPKATIWTGLVLRHLHSGIKVFSESAVSNRASPAPVEG